MEGAMEKDSSHSTCSSSNDIFPHPLCKQLLAKGDESSRLPLQAVHLHLRSTDDAGASRMITVRDVLRRDVVATEQYNTLKMAAARGELSQPVFEYSRKAIFLAAEGDNMTPAPSTGANGSGASIFEDKFKEQVVDKFKEQEDGTLGYGGGNSTL
jgi:hypothetical protein